MLFATPANGEIPKIDPREGGGGIAGPSHNRTEIERLGKRPAVGRDIAMGTLLSRIPGREPMRPSLPHLSPTDPHSTPLCTAAHLLVPGLTSHGAPFLSHKSLRTLRPRTHPAPPQEETPVPGQALAGEPRGVQAGVWKEEGGEQSPPSPPLRLGGGGPGSALPRPHPSPMAGAA